MDTRVRNVAAASLASLVVFGEWAALRPTRIPPGKKITVQTNKVKYNRWTTGQSPGRSRTGRMPGAVPPTGNGFKKFAETRANRRGKAEVADQVRPHGQRQVQDHRADHQDLQVQGDKSVTTFRVR